MTESLSMLPGMASVPLALSVVILSFVPLWSGTLWMAGSALPWRWKAEHSAWRLAAAAYLIAAILAGILGAGWAANDLLGSGRDREKDIVLGGWVIQAVGWMITMVLVIGSWSAPGALVNGRVRGGSIRLRIAIAILLGCSLAAVVRALEVPRQTLQVLAIDWFAFAASSVGVAATCASIASAIRETRRLVRGAR